MLTFNMGSEIFALYLLFITALNHWNEIHVLCSLENIEYKKCIQILKISWISSGYVKQTVLRCVLEHIICVCKIWQP